MRRSCGILLHPTSLPGPYGIGEIGSASLAFADALVRMNQGWWQTLPVGPTGYGDSPYQLLSSFAGNPLLLDLETLRGEGWLSSEELRNFPKFPADRVDFSIAIPWRMERLRMAADRFASEAPPRLRSAFHRYTRAHHSWLPDFALFMALKSAHGGQAWTSWNPGLAAREPTAMERARRDHAEEILRQEIWQFWFDRQWRALRKQLRRRKIRLIGDVPIFVAHDSADVWANRHLFQLDARGHPTVIAGVPPDYFSATGQRWGNPLYRWESHRASGFSWWIARMRRATELADLVRVDHFRGFAAHWEIPASEETAIHGRWVPGPGAELFDALQKALGKLPVLAEDLGVITPDVELLRDTFRLPGMKILQFETWVLQESPPRKPEAVRKNTVIYTGTHDNDTTMGWFTSPPVEGTPQTAESLMRDRLVLLDYTGTDGSALHRDFAGLAYRSRAVLAMLPMQDVLGLGGEARMNLPGRPWGNWQWRMEAGALTSEMERWLGDLALQNRRGPLTRAKAPRG